MNSKLLRALAAAAAGALLLTACGTDNDDDPDAAGDNGDPTEGADPDDFDEPSSVDVVVHTGPGGGSDVFARALTQLLADEGVVSGQWPVQNVDGGSGAAAISHMTQQGDRDDTIAAITMTWITTPLTADGVPTLDQLTPIAQVLVEPTFIAIRTDAEYDDFEGMIEWGQDNPGQLTQAGGSPTAHASLVGEMIQEETGTEWQFVSYPGGGERIASLLGGDSDLMLGSVEDFAQHVESGDLEIIALVEDEPFEALPDVPTLQELGYDIDSPDQVRGFVGPPEMPPEAVAYYENVIEEATQTEAWDDFMLENGWISAFAPAEEWGANLDELSAQMEQLLAELGDVEE